jgi:outer membrane protein TolC
MLVRMVAVAWIMTAAIAWAAPRLEPGSGGKLDKATQEKIRLLQGQHRDTLKEEVRAREEEFDAGRGATEALLRASGQLLKAELELATTAKERITAHAEHLKLMRKIEKITRSRHDAGQIKTSDNLQARAARMAAEIAWLKAGGKEKKE